MRNARIVFGFMLILALGCGSKTDSPPAAKTPLDDGTGAATTTAATTGTAVPPTTTPPPPSKPAEWEMDAANHAVPTAPATGKLGGAAFTPTVEFVVTDNTLSFRVLKNSNPEREIQVKFSPDQVKTIQGLKLVVTDKDDAGPKVPEITTVTPPSAGAKFENRVAFNNGYALTLELGMKVNGQIPGKVYLSLRDEGKTFLAGTFTAEWVRDPSKPPEPDDGPFVHGAVGVVNSPGSFVHVGYLGVDKGGKAHGDTLGLEMESARYTMSDQHKPTMSMLVADGVNKPGRYDHTRLVPGQYIVYAAAGMKTTGGLAAPTGPSAWKWLTVTADTKEVVNFTLDGRKAGKVELTLPADAKGHAWLMPPTDPAVPFPAELTQAAAAGLGLRVEVEKGKATFPNVTPGTYQVFAGDLTGSVTVEVGKTATVALTPTKK